jgi:hypothetical protein
MTHEGLMERLLADLEAGGATNIRAHGYADFPTPEKIAWRHSDKGHIPDVTADLFGRHFIFEVETDETLFSDHTKSQLELFAQLADERQAVCGLVIPKMTAFRALALCIPIGTRLQVFRY